MPHAAGHDHQAASRLRSRERRGSRQFRDREDPDQQDAHDAFAVKVAPQRDERDCPPQRSHIAGVNRALDEPRAGGDPGEGNEVRTGNDAWLENEEPEYEDRRRRQRSALHAAGEVDESQCGGNGQRLERLDRGITSQLPGSVGRGLGQP